MVNDGGGWTVFQRRQDGSVDFYKYWADYVNGFGNLSGEFWLGLDNIHRLTKGRQNTLRLDFKYGYWYPYYAQYSTFSVGDSTTKYTLTVGSPGGNGAGDSLSGRQSLNGMKFTTRDNDNDYHFQNCAVLHHGAWWYKSCSESNLNGRYFDDNNVNNATGIVWYELRQNYAIQFTEMKTRRNY